ncbi:MAG: hypothetical protein IIW31_09505 [Clostridia bacterium]|nr:hypothetical protein [Clostridia bacterium]
MNKKTGTILGVILGIITFVGVVALLCYIFRDKLRALCGCGCDCDCDCCCGDDDHGYFEVVESCGCCDDGVDEEPVADGE